MALDEKVLLSVVIPVYNGAVSIDRCIGSVRSQTYRNLEIILVDDGSMDGSGEICDAYAEADARISVIHQENRGLVSARKRGVGRAGGDVVAFVDADDWIEPDMYECMMAAYMDGKPDMVTSGMIVEHGAWRRVHLDGAGEGSHEKDAIAGCILPGLMHDIRTDRPGITPALWNKLMARPMLRELLDRADEGLTYGEDGAVVYGLVARAGKITVIHDAWYHYMYHEDSMSHTYGPDSFEKIFRYRKSLLDTFEELGIEKKMARQIGWSVRNFLRGAIKNLFGVNMGDIAWVFPYECVPKGSRILLYGAGDVGYSYWRCIRQGTYVELAAWADQRYAELREAGLPVESIDSAARKGYDYVVIAIQEEGRAEEIRRFLVGHGIMEDRIIWKQNQEL